MSLNYISVSLPRDLIKKVDEVLSHKELGYSSRPEFIKDAVRRHLEFLGIKFTLKEEKV
jgi:metal-responsive CopG/Arc/MetJ family transcriptional regulator